MSSRYHSSAASPICSFPMKSAKSASTGPARRSRLPPVASAQRNAATLIPIRVLVTSAPLPWLVARRTPVVTRWVPCGFPEWSGQRIPTGAKVAQSVQIGRPQSEQERPVSRFGCR